MAGKKQSAFRSALVFSETNSYLCRKQHGPLEKGLDKKQSAIRSALVFSEERRKSDDVLLSFFPVGDCMIISCSTCCYDQVQNQFFLRVQSGAYA